MSEPTPAAEFRSVPLGVLWAVAGLAALLAYGVTPWDAIADIVANVGVSDETAFRIGFVAGYAAPLTIAVFGLMLAYLLGAFRDASAYTILVSIGGALFVAGAASAHLGVGLAPDFSVLRPSGPWYISLPLWAVAAYVSAYGFLLVVAAVVIGIAAAIQFERWFHD